jgi:hypothetical protein
VCLLAALELIQREEYQEIGEALSGWTEAELRTLQREDLAMLFPGDRAKISKGLSLLRDLPGPGMYVRLHCPLHNSVFFLISVVLDVHPMLAGSFPPLRACRQWIDQTSLVAHRVCFPIRSLLGPSRAQAHLAALRQREG